MAGYAPPFFGHGRVKVVVDQSAVSVSRCNKVGTLLCHVLTRLYPVVSFTLNIVCLCVHYLHLKDTYPAPSRLLRTCPVKLGGFSTR